MNHTIPAYQQIYHELREDILKGRYPYGSKLPSKRTLALEKGVSVITAVHAVELLCEEGYAKSRERSGSYVIYRESDFQGQAWPDTVYHPELAWPGTVSHAEPARHDIVSPLELAGSEPETVVRDRPSQIHTGNFPFSVLAGTMRRGIQDFGERLLVKSPNQGCLQLQQAICAYLGRSRRIDVLPEQVVIGSGAEYLYGMIAQLFRGQVSFALENPSYHKIRQVYEAFGIPCEMLDLGPDGIKSEALKAARAAILHVTPFHSFPSEITASASKKYEYLNWAGTRGGYLVEDNYDSELTVSRKAEEPLFSMSREENVIYINTFSKTIAPSIRVGYMILPVKLLNTFQNRLGFYSCTVPVFEQYVLAELLQNGDYERQINRIRRQKRRAL